jgi:hypothetical protein
MTTTQNDKCTDKTPKTGEIRMGREVAAKKDSCCDSDHAAKVADIKAKTRENQASSLV